jgi:hypothetical protein
MILLHIHERFSEIKEDEFPALKMVHVLSRAREKWNGGKG